jgi:hypothetical protein
MDDKFPHLPAWTCHKVVHAGKIDSIEHDPIKFQSRLGLAWDIPATEYDNAPGRLFVGASAAWVEKHKPQVGGYFVVYADGYTSYSPAEAFEDGYSRQE